MPNAGQQQFLGIQLTMDTSGVVTGAALAEKGLQGVQRQATQTQAAVSAGANNMAMAMQASVAVGMAGMASAGVGSAIQSEFLAPMIDQAGDFEVEMSQVKFVTQAAGEELQKLRDVALRTGLETQFSPTEAARAIRMLKAAGLDTEVTLKSLKATLDLVTASAGSMDLQTGATATAAALLKFKRTGEDAVEIMDTFAQSTRETNMQLRDLPIFLNSLRDAPARMKLSTEEAFALGGVLRNAGMMAAQAGNTIAGFGRKMLQNQRIMGRYMAKLKMTEEQLMSLSDEELAQKVGGRQLMKIRAMKNFGLQVFDSNNKMRDMTDLFADIIDKSKGLRKENEKTFLVSMQALFGDQASSLISALGLMERKGIDGSAAIRDLIQTLGDAKGTAREAAAAFEETKQGMDVFIEGTKETIQVVMGTTLFPVLKAFSLMLREILARVLDFVKANPAFSKALGLTAIIVSILAKAVGLFLIAAAGALMWASMLGPAIAKMGGFAAVTAMGVQALTLAMKGLLIGGGAVLALFIVIQGAMKLWAKIWDKSSKGVFLSIREFLTDIKLIWQGLIEWWDGGPGSIDLYRALEDRGLTEFVITLIQLKERVAALFSGIWEGIKEVLTPIGAAFLWVADTVALLLDEMRILFRLSDTADISEQIEGWRTLGRILGWLAGIVMVKWIIVTTRMAVSAIPKLLAGMWAWVKALGRLLVRTVAFIVKGLVWMIAQTFTLALRVIPRLLVSMVAWIIQTGALVIAYIQLKAVMIATYAKALAKGLVTLGRTIVAFAAKNAVMLITIGRYILIGAAVVALVALYGLLISKAVEVGEAIGPALKDFHDKMLTNLSEVIISFKNWGRDLSKAFTEAFKGNFEPFLTWLEQTWNLIKTGLDFMFGDATERDLAMAIQPFAATQAQREVAQDALARHGGAAQGVSQRDVIQRVQREEKQRTAERVRRAAQISIKEMNFNVKEATPEEARRLSQMIMENLRDMTDEENEVAFQ